MYSRLSTSCNILTLASSYCILCFVEKSTSLHNFRFAKLFLGIAGQGTKETQVHTSLNYGNEL